MASEKLLGIEIALLRHYRRREFAEFAEFAEVTNSLRVVECQRKLLCLRASLATMRFLGNMNIPQRV